MNPLDCPWCGAWTRPVFKRAHYECGRCGRILVDCCDGETAEPHSEDVTDTAIPPADSGV